MEIVISNALYIVFYWVFIPLVILNIIAILLLLGYDEGKGSLWSFSMAYVHLKWYNKIIMVFLFLCIIPATIPRSIKFLYVKWF